MSCRKTIYCFPNEVPAPAPVPPAPAPAPIYIPYPVWPGTPYPPAAGFCPNPPDTKRPRPVSPVSASVVDEHTDCGCGCAGACGCEPVPKKPPNKPTEQPPLKKPLPDEDNKCENDDDCGEDPLSGGRPPEDLVPDIPDVPGCVHMEKMLNTLSRPNIGKKEPTDLGFKFTFGPDGVPEDNPFLKKDCCFDHIGNGGVDDDELVFTAKAPLPPLPPPPPPGTLVQYTPQVRHGDVGGADGVLQALEASMNVPSVNSQDPNGFWITPEQWDTAAWDGVPLPWETMTRQELCSALFPTPNTMLGLRERFYEVNPYADNTNPTVAEIDYWNLEIVRHLRKVLGITTPVEADKCLYLRAQWAQERKHSTYWDTKYPGTLSTPYGPCVGGGGFGYAHCGADFRPDAADQAEYEPPNGFCGPTAGSEGIISVNKDLPWSIKLTRVIMTWICTEGTNGHAGPFLRRTRMGIAWHNFAGNATEFRGKWSG